MSTDQNLNIHSDLNKMQKLFALRPTRSMQLENIDLSF